MKILLIDNHDSFTYNLLELLRKFLPEKNIALKTYSEFQNHRDFDKIVISPGPGNPREYPKIIELFKQYPRKPIIGVCLGHQIMALAFGAKMENIPPVHGQPRKISLREPVNIFRNIPKTFQVGLYHSWLVSKDNFPEELRILATSHPEDYIMAIKHKSFPYFGLQFHPESYISEFGDQILSNFLEL